MTSTNTPSQLRSRPTRPRARPTSPRPSFAAFGVDAVIDDQIEGGTVPIEGEEGVVVEVRAEDAADAAEILREDPVAPPED